MNLKEAREVVAGERSYKFQSDKPEEQLACLVAMAEANAHLAHEAYWVLRAYDEGLFEAELSIVDDEVAE